MHVDWLSRALLALSAVAVLLVTVVGRSGWVLFGVCAMVAGARMLFPADQHVPCSDCGALNAAETETCADCGNVL